MIITLSGHTPNPRGDERESFTVEMGRSWSEISKELLEQIGGKMFTNWEVMILDDHKIMFVKHFADAWSIFQILDIIPDQIDSEVSRLWEELSRLVKVQSQGATDA